MAQAQSKTSWDRRNYVLTTHVVLCNQGVEATTYLCLHTYVPACNQYMWTDDVLIEYPK